MTSTAWVASYIKKKRLYYLPHTHAAMTCLKAGYRENAASWMEKDFGEQGDETKVDPASLEIVHDPDGSDMIAWLPLDLSGLNGEGI